MLRNLFFTVIAGLLFLVFVWAISEMVLRFVDPQFSHFGFGYLEPNLELRYKNKPDCRLELKTNQLDADFYTNSQGFRAKEEIPKISQKEQVLFIGDSFTYGFGVKLQDVFSTVLQEKVDRMNKEIEIVNAGVVGYGTDQQYLYIKELCNTIKPKLVVMNMYANDPTDNIWRALFYLENDALKQNPSLVISPTARLKWFLEERSHLFIFLSRLAGKEISKRGLWGSINPHLGIILAHLRILADHLLDWPFYEKTHDFNRDNCYPAMQMVDFYNKKFGEDCWNYGWALEKKLVEEISNFLKRKGIPCLFVLVPMKCQCVGQKTVFDVFQKNMIDIFKELNVPFLDLREQMANHTDLYLTDDGHWSISGHAFFADIMLKYLLKRDQRPSSMANLQS